MDNLSENSRCSSFEALSHDPNLLKLAKTMFQKTNDYLSFELSSNLMDYELLEKMNGVASKNIEEMKLVTNDIVVANDEFQTQVKLLEPLLKELDGIETTVDKLEIAAYRLDSYAIKLEEKIDSHIQKQKPASM